MAFFEVRLTAEVKDVLEAFATIEAPDEEAAVARALQLHAAGHLKFEVCYEAPTGVPEVADVVEVAAAEDGRGVQSERLGMGEG